MLGVPFAIHAGKRYDWDAEDAIARCGVDLPNADPTFDARGAVIGVATIERVVSVSCLPGYPDHSSALTPEQCRWFFGPFGWVLRDVARLSEPVPSRGYQMFWTQPSDVETAVVAQLSPRPR